MFVRHPRSTSVVFHKRLCWKVQAPATVACLLSACPDMRSLRAYVNRVNSSVVRSVALMPPGSAWTAMVLAWNLFLLVLLFRSSMSSASTRPEPQEFAFDDAVAQMPIAVGTNASYASMNAACRELQGATALTGPAPCGVTRRTQVGNSVFHCLFASACAATIAVPHPCRLLPLGNPGDTVQTHESDEPCPSERVSRDRFPLVVAVTRCARENGTVSDDVLAGSAPIPIGNRPQSYCLQHLVEIATRGWPCAHGRVLS